MDQPLTQQQLAKKLRRDQTWVSRYERGAAPWTPEVMLSFAVALDSTVPVLFPWPIGVDEIERYRVRGTKGAA